MTWIIEFIFGPTVPENPNYEVIQDVTNLIPWWYPHFVMGCMMLFLILLWAGYQKKLTPVVRATAVRTARRGTRPQ